MYKGYTIPIHWELTLDELIELVSQEIEVETQTNNASDEAIERKKLYKEDPR